MVENALLPLVKIHSEDVEAPLIVCMCIIGKSLKNKPVKKHASLVAASSKLVFNHANIFTKAIPECCLLICLGLVAGELFYAWHGVHLGIFEFTNNADINTGQC